MHHTQVTQLVFARGKGIKFAREIRINEYLIVKREKKKGWLKF